MQETSSSYTARQRTTTGGAADPDWHPWAPDAMSITTYADAKEVLTSSRFESTASPGSEPVWSGTLTTSNGRSHIKRRRWLAPLVSRAAVARFDAEVLDMAMAEFLGRQLYEEGKSGPVDLIPLLRLMLIPIMSGFVGIDDMDNAQRSARLRQLIEHFNAGSSLLQYATTDRDALVRAALDAIDTYTTEFFESSRQRRARLVERVRAGELSESDLPRDVLTRQLLDTNALWDEPTAIRDSMILLTGGLHTTAVATAQVLDAYYGWRERSENDVDDIELMHAVVNETLRVFPIVEFVPRCAKEDTILNSGKEIAAGTHLVVNIFLANRDPAAFGADADTYRPGRYRELTTSVQHYGLAFGAGPHLCIGKPLVALGRADAQEMSVPRIIVKVVSWLLRAGIHPAPQQEPDQEQTYRRMLASYPVQVPQGAPAGASAIPRSD